MAIEKEKYYMKISLGSILYCWPKQTVYDFYDAIKDSSIDTIYIGEAVCSKRKELLYQEWFTLAKELAHTGKEVILTSLALVESPSKLNDVKRAVENGEFIIEANDFSAVNLCYERQLPFVAGHALNIYNADTLKVLLKNGMKRWCIPVELSKEWFLNIIKDTKELGIWGKFETEIFSYGYLPLAYSARCFTARAMNKVKADCGICCMDDPNGRAVYSQEGMRIFTMNGIQTQSGACYNLINELQELNELIDYIRLSPLGIDILETLQTFKDKLIHPEKIFILDKDSCHGYWSGQAGMC